MGQRPCDAEIRPRNYPISLRQSARAVFGTDYDRAERDPEPNRDTERGPGGTIITAP